MNFILLFCKYTNKNWWFICIWKRRQWVDWRIEGAVEKVDEVRDLETLPYNQSANTLVSEIIYDQ